MTDESNLKEQVDKLQAALAGLDSFVSKIFESRQGYYEKLALLNGATLTLLFSAMGLVAKGASPAARFQLASPVFVGCLMLVISIILCIVHNYINLYFLFHGQASVIGFSINTIRQRLRNALVKVGASLDGLDLDISETPSVHFRYVPRTERMCLVLGVLAQGLTIAAYVQFLWVVRIIFLNV